MVVNIVDIVGWLHKIIDLKCKDALYFFIFLLFSFVFLSLWYIFVLYLFVSVVTYLMDRYTVSESCLAEETPPVMSSTSPPGRLLLLPDRHAGGPRALWPFPQCGHQEELHTVIPVSSYFLLSRGSMSIISKHCPRVEKYQVRCWRMPASADEIYFQLSVNKAVGLGEDVLWISWLNANNFRLLVRGL